MSGWRRMVPVDEQGASSSTASNGPACHSSTSAATVSAGKPETREFLVEPGEPGRRAVDRRDLRARERELRGLAAGRRAQVRDGKPAHVAEQPGGQRCGGILHPPGALGETRHAGDQAMGDGAHGAGRQHAPAQALRPALRVVLHRQIERRLVAVHPREGARGIVTVVANPARHQPGGRIQACGIEVGERGRGIARDPPQHRIDEADIARAAAVGLGEPYRKIDGRMIRHVHEQELGGAHQKDRLDARGVARVTAVERGGEQMPQCPEAPERGRDQHAHERAIAVGKRGQGRMRVLAAEMIVERAMMAQHAVEDVDGDAAGGEAGDLPGQRPLGSWHETFNLVGARGESRKSTKYGRLRSR